MNCSDAVDKNDGRDLFYFNDDGTISSEYDDQECIYIPDQNQAKNWAYGGRTEASSTIGDGSHDSFRAIGIFYV